jgi:uncharacterized membrane protein YkgB
MDSLIKVLARSPLLKGDLDYHLVRASMVLIFLLFGYQKWFEYEAETLIGPEAGEVMAVVQAAMLAGLPYTGLRDAIVAHPTMAEGLRALFSEVQPSPTD